ALGGPHRSGRGAGQGRTTGTKTRELPRARRTTGIRNPRRYLDRGCILVDVQIRLRRRGGAVRLSGGALDEGAEVLRRADSSRRPCGGDGFVSSHYWRRP